MSELQVDPVVGYRMFEIEDANSSAITTSDGYRGRIRRTATRFAGAFVDGRSG